MSENPFAAPESSGSATEVLNVDQLCSIAWRQKAMLLAAMTNLLVNICTFVDSGVPLAEYIPLEKTPSLVIVVITVGAGILMVVAFTNIVLTALLATQVFGPVRGVVCGLLAAFPFFGLLSTIVVSRKATALLRSQDIPVGFRGANLREIRRRMELKASSESIEN